MIFSFICVTFNSAFPLCRYADVYTSRVANFGRYSPFVSFQSQAQVWFAIQLKFFLVLMPSTFLPPIQPSTTYPCPCIVSEQNFLAIATRTNTDSHHTNLQSYGILDVLNSLNLSSLASYLLLLLLLWGFGVQPSKLRDSFVVMVLISEMCM